MRKEDPVLTATREQLERDGQSTHGRAVPADPTDEVYRATLAEVQRKKEENE